MTDLSLSLSPRETVYLRCKLPRELFTCVRLHVELPGELKIVVELDCRLTLKVVVKSEDKTYKLEKKKMYVNKAQQR